MLPYLRYLLLFPVMLNAGISQSQDLSLHRWKDRLIMVVTSDTTLAVYQDQLKIFKEEAAGMKDRKLVLYKIAPGQYHVGEGNHPWKRSDSLYKKLKMSDSNLEVILIGLDGTTKLRRTGILSTEELFATIDAMPMRRREMKQKKEDRN